jgi:intracellular sulfur oxidation DsrE/DsrF family protein
VLSGTFFLLDKTIRDNMKTLFRVVTAIFLLSAIAGNGIAADSATTLAGLGEAKAYFDVNIGEPGKLLIRLELIDTTYRQLVAAGVKPTIVVGIRGKASYFFTRDENYVLDIDLPVKKKAAAWLERFAALGFRLEQCILAAGLHEIDVEDFLPQLELVDNGYIAMIAYQARGYSFVPMD